MFGFEIFSDRIGNIELVRRRIDSRGFLRFEHFAWIKRAKL